jgi:hypothetical protein
MTLFSESTVEDATLAWFGSRGYLPAGRHGAVKADIVADARRAH